MIGRFWNAGQACLAVKRLYVFAEVYDEFVEGAGPAKWRATSRATAWSKPKKPRIRMGPLHTASQREEVLDQIADALDKGAGSASWAATSPEGEGLAHGNYLNPALLVNLTGGQ